MIQEERISNYHFIKGDYVSVKIKMEPQSLLLEVPLDWQINKIKCLLVKTIFKLQFDMFAFHHDGQQIPGDLTLKTVIQQDKDIQCIRGDHYVLNFVRFEAKQPLFEKYYLSKMKPLVKSLQDSPFQPILHPGYYSMKYLNHINHIPFEGGRELIVNFNQLQQMQNVIQQQRRQNEVVEGNAMGLGLLGLGGNNNAGWMGWLGIGLIRFIQIISLITIIKFLAHNSTIEVFIVIAFIAIVYFVIDYNKNANKKVQNTQQTVKAEQTQENKQVVEKQAASGLDKLYYTIAIFMVQKICLILECSIAFAISFFPNWTIQSHLQWFKSTDDSIKSTLNRWKQKISVTFTQEGESSRGGANDEEREEQGLRDEEVDNIANEDTQKSHEE